MAADPLQVWTIASATIISVAMLCGISWLIGTQCKPVQKPAGWPSYPVRCLIWLATPGKGVGKVKLGDAMLHWATMPQEGAITTFDAKGPDGVAELTLSNGSKVPYPEPGRWKCVVRGGTEFNCNKDAATVTIHLFYLETLPPAESQI